MALLRLWPRLIAAYLIVGVLLYYGWPHLSLVMTHAAGTLLLLANPVPYLGEFGWAESSIRVSDRIFGMIFSVNDPSLLFTFGFPVGFALSLPGMRTRTYWWRLFWTLVASLGMCSVVLAIMTDSLFEANLGRFGLDIHAAWYSGFLEYAYANFLTFSMILYPFLACLILARVALMAGSFRVVSVRTTAQSERPARRFDIHLMVLTGMLVLFSVAENRAGELRDLPREDVFKALAARNPELGKSFVEYADARAAAGKYRQALRWYRRSSEYAGYEKVADARIDRLRSTLRERGRRLPPADSRLSR